MKTRKIILLSAIGALAVIYTLQLAHSGASGAKVLSLKEEADTVTVRSIGASTGAGGDGSAAVLLQKSDTVWTVGSKAYKADSAVVDSLVESVAKLKVLGSVSGGGGLGDDDRYGLAEGSALEITLSKGGKTLRTVRVGKASPTGQQTYVTVDGKKEVLLVSGNLAENFGKTEGDLRNKDVYTFAADTLLGLTVSGPGTYSLIKSGTPGVWSLAPEAKVAAGANGAPGSAGESAPALELDQEKTGAWVSSLANLRASTFLEDSTPLPASALASVSMDFGVKKVTVSIFEKRPDGEYTCASSESPSPFTVSGYVAEKYLKKLADLAK